MKLLALILLSFILFTNCSKETDKLGPEYHALIGEWENVAELPADKVHISFKKNGRITLEVATERGIGFKAEKVGESTMMVNGQQWTRLSFYRENETINIGKKPGEDSITVSGYVNIANDTVLSKYPVFHKIK